MIVEQIQCVGGPWDGMLVPSIAPPQGLDIMPILSGVYDRTIGREGKDIWKWSYRYFTAADEASYERCRRYNQ